MEEEESSQTYERSQSLGTSLSLGIEEDRIQLPGVYMILTSITCIRSDIHGLTMNTGSNPGNTGWTGLSYRMTSKFYPVLDYLLIHVTVLNIIYWVELKPCKDIYIMLTG